MRVAQQADGLVARVDDVAELHLARLEDHHRESSGVAQLDLLALAVGHAARLAPLAGRHLELCGHVARMHEHDVVLHLGHQHVATRVDGQCGRPAQQVVVRCAARPRDVLLGEPLHLDHPRLRQHRLHLGSAALPRTLV